MDLARHIRPIPDFPKPGILFRDITPLLADPAALAAAIDRLAAPWRDAPPAFVAAVEARGFLFAAPLALELGAGLIPVRKPGKLPADTISHEYELEYGRDRLEMHRDMLPAGAGVLVGSGWPPITGIVPAGCAPSGWIGVRIGAGPPAITGAVPVRTPVVPSSTIGVTSGSVPIEIGRPPSSLWGSTAATVPSADGGV